MVNITLTRQINPLIDFQSFKGGGEKYFSG